MYIHTSIQIYAPTHRQTLSLTHIQTPEMVHHHLGTNRCNFLSKPRQHRLCAEFPREKMIFPKSPVPASKNPAKKAVEEKMYSKSKLGVS